MTQEHYKHPITPPTDLVQQLIEDTPLATGAARELHLITVAYQAGADQELEACCDVLSRWGVHGIHALRTARRPKPLSLKQQALEALTDATGSDYPYPMTLLSAEQHALIRRALEALSDD